jgi:5'-nucleotidase
MGESPEADYTPATVGDDATVGGMARLASAIGIAKAAATSDGMPVLLLDAGDFTMGTLFEFLATTQAPELRFMQALGYDATTIGNHELDWTPHGLAGILQAAVTAQVTVPILASNMGFSATSTADDEVKAFFDAGVIKTKLVKTVGDLKVGFFGLLGADAVQVTPQASPLTFEAIDAAAMRMVTELRTVDKVDLVIALSHSGIDSTGKGEDAVLATKVPGIDIIISGHTHDKLVQPAIVGQTVIVTAGSYGQYLGNLQISVTPAATAGGQPTVTVDSYQLQSIDDTRTGDSATQTQIDAFIAGLDTALAPNQLSYKKVVAKTGANLPLPAYSEAPVGNLVTDAYRTIGAALQPTDPPVIAVEGNGQLRAPITMGKTGLIWFADLFRVSPIGIGPNQVPGFPLVTFYLNAKDIRSGLELGAAMEAVPDQYFLQLSGVKVEYDMALPLFGRVSSLKLVTPTGDQVLDLTNTTTCYKVIATNYVAGLLGVVNSFTSGFPPDAAGIPTVPAAYATAQGRITKK